MMPPMTVSAGVDTRLVRILARMALHVLDTGSAVSGGVALGRSEAETSGGSLCFSHVP